MDSFTNPIEDFIPPREIPRRRLIHSGIAQQKFRRAVLEAAAEISAEFSVETLLLTHRLHTFLLYLLRGI